MTIKKGSHGTRNYTANWKPEVKTISFDPAGGQWEDGKTAAVTEKADYDSYIMLHDAPSRDYYIFKWWEDSNGNNFVPGHQYKVTKNQEFKALWEPIEYSIIYELDGGFVPDDANPIVYTTETEDFTLVNPEKDDYVFLGWTGSNGDEPEKKVTIKKGSLDNRTYTANWEQMKTTKPEDKTKGTKGKGTPTGDGFNPLLWAILLLSSAVALAALHLRKQ